MGDREKLKRLKELGRLADLSWQAEAARFSELRRRETQAAAQVEELDAGRSAWDAAPPEARFAGAGRGWQDWTDQRIAGLNQARALARAQMEAERPKLARAFGRTEVLKALARKRDTGTG